MDDRILAGLRPSSLWALRLRGVPGCGVLALISRQVWCLLLLCGLLPWMPCGAQPTLPLTVSERLQGTWQGVVVGDTTGAQYTVRVNGSSFYFHRDTNFWFETTIRLPEKTEPQQLHATIKNTAKGQESSIGKVVVAVLKIEGETLTIVSRGDGSEDLPQSLEVTEDKGVTHYRLQRVPSASPPSKKP